MFAVIAAVESGEAALEFLGLTGENVGVSIHFHIFVQINIS